VYWEEILWENGGMAEEKVEGVFEEEVCVKIDIIYHAKR